MSDLRVRSRKRTQLLTLRLFASEAAMLVELAALDNRSPGEFLRALLYQEIRTSHPQWRPSEITDAKQV